MLNQLEGRHVLGACGCYRLKLFFVYTYLICVYLVFRTRLYHSVLWYVSILGDGRNQPIVSHVTNTSSPAAMTK